MNAKAVYKYVSDKLNTNLRFYYRNKKTMEIIGNIDDKKLLTTSTVDKIFEVTRISLPSLSCINNKYYYGSIIYANGAILIGPIYSSTIIKLSNGLIFDADDSSFNLQEVFLLDFFDSLLLINNFLNEEISIEDLIRENFLDKELSLNINKRINNIRFEYNEINKKHDPYQTEQRLINAITSGDMRLINQASMESIRSEHGIVSEDELQNNKSLAIVGITIASRAAIKAGVDNEVALSLTDSFIQEINKAKNEQELETLVFNCNIELTKLVSEHNSTYSSKDINSPSYYSSKVKSYISNHLHQKIKISDIATNIGVTPNYLSNLFKKSEGITISDYILKEKISLSKNMILYSDMTLLEIALYLGFSSQSHFCKVFKRISNITPLEFKKALT